MYNVAQIVAGELVAAEYPAPKVMLHGPRSVVFYWGQGTNNLYVTVSEDFISLLVSSQRRIQLRLELPRNALLGSSVLLPAIESARLGRPVVTRKQPIGTAP